MIIGLLSACITSSFDVSLVSSLERPEKYVSLNTQPWKTRQSIVNVNPN